MMKPNSNSKHRSSPTTNNTKKRRPPRQQKGRDITGILLLDKPIKLTSNAALQNVKRCFQARKAGHTGSLDPLATGMLPICFGEATKFSQYVLNADKHYLVTAKLGVETNTGDAEGQVTAHHHVPELTTAEIEKILDKFRGEIDQVPSMFSALKHQGKPLYKLARQGVEIERQARKVMIYDLTLKYAGKDTLDLAVHCSKGTYVRTLVEDIGKALNCGAHVTHLRRTKIGNFSHNVMVEMSTIEELTKTGNMTDLDKLMVSIDQVLPKEWPEINLTNAASFYLRRGQAVRLPRTPDAGWMKLYHNEGQFLGIGEIDEEGRISPRRLVKQTTVITRKQREIEAI